MNTMGEKQTPWDFGLVFPRNNCIQHLHQGDQEEQGSDLDGAVSPVPTGDAETSSVLALTVQFAPGGDRDQDDQDCEDDQDSGGAYCTDRAACTCGSSPR